MLRTFTEKKANPKCLVVRLHPHAPLAGCATACWVVRIAIAETLGLVPERQSTAHEPVGAGRRVTLLASVTLFALATWQAREIPTLAIGPASLPSGAFEWIVLAGWRA